MAILPEFPGFEATVVVNGAVCEELLAPTDADEDDPTLVTRYIEATPGANFEVHVCVPPNAKYINDYDIAVWVKVDGQLILKPLFRKYIGKRHPRIIKGLEELSNTGWIRRDLVFSNLSTGNVTPDLV
jgi:hypothetical protein